MNEEYFEQRSEETEDFKKELTSLLNRYSWDNACETPDHILADYVENCLKNLCSTMALDIAWHNGWERLGDEINTFKIPSSQPKE